MFELKYVKGCKDKFKRINNVFDTGLFAYSIQSLSLDDVLFD